jgi:hypothetical protein
MQSFELAHFYTSAGEEEEASLANADDESS